MSNEEVAEILLSSGAVVLSPDKPFRFASGIMSPIYCDNRMLLSLPSERHRIVDLFVERINAGGLDADVIAGIATASIPWAALVADRLGKPMVYIRKEVKEHGKLRLIEGASVSGKNVLVIEDLVSTGSSSLAAVSAARGEGAVVDSCLAIFTYGLAAAKRAFARENCALFSLTDLAALLAVASKQGFLDSNEIRSVVQWNQDPEGWKG